MDLDNSLALRLITVCSPDCPETFGTFRPSTSSQIPPVPTGEIGDCSQVCTPMAQMFTSLPIDIGMDEMECTGLCRCSNILVADQSVSNKRKGLSRSSRIVNLTLYKSCR